MDSSFFEIVSATEEDSEAIVAALAEIAEEADFVHPFTMTVEQERQFISNMYKNKDGVILLAKASSHPHLGYYIVKIMNMRSRLHYALTSLRSRYGLNLTTKTNIISHKESSK